MREEQYRDIEHKMEASIRGYSFTMDEARELAKRFLHILEQSVYPTTPVIQVDPDLPPGTVELRYGKKVVGRIENIGLTP